MATFTHRMPRVIYAPFNKNGDFIKKTYKAPVLVKREMLTAVTAAAPMSWVPLPVPQ